jgi:signal transduction histidine kinase
MTTPKISLEDAEELLQRAKQEVRELLEELEKLKGEGIDKGKLEAELKEIHKNLEQIPPFHSVTCP